MKFYDRFFKQTIDSSSLPEQIDLGRYFVSDDRLDLTYRVLNLGSDKRILQSLLESDNKSQQDLYCQFYNMVKRSQSDIFEIFPIIQSIKEKLFLNEFEETLEKQLFHIEEIFRQPHYLLQRISEKVNVSRAKRIPAKGYQDLASHTEDWLQKSIVAFHPRRILTEELDLQYDVYENQVTVAFIERCLHYLSSRIKEIHDIKIFLEEYAQLLDERDDSRGWYKKIERNLCLIGKTYKEENPQKGNQDADKLSDTHNRLKKLQQRLMALQNLPLYHEINKRAAQSLLSEKEVKPTNVMVNHTHYKFVRELWRKLNEKSQVQTEEEKANYEQKVIAGVRSYAKVLFAYLMQDDLKYKLKGTYSNWTAERVHYPSVTFKESDNNLLDLTIGNYYVRFLVVCNESTISENEIPVGSYVLSLGRTKRYGKIISISPYDVDSVERIGKLVKTFIIQNHIDQMKQKFVYPPALSDYVELMKDPMVKFEEKYHFSFIGIPQNEISKEKTCEILKKDRQFLKKSRKEQQELLEKLDTLVNDINKKAFELESNLFCLSCLQPFGKKNLLQLDYIQCKCGFYLDSKTNHIKFSKHFKGSIPLSEEQLGMDHIEYDVEKIKPISVEPTIPSKKRANR